MPAPAAVRLVDEARLRLSPVPVAELGAAAMDAMRDVAPVCDFLIVAVPAGLGPQALDRIVVSDLVDDG